MISGLYLGEAARLRINELIESDQLFAVNKRRALEVFSEKGNFDSVALSAVEAGYAGQKNSVAGIIAVVHTGSDCEGSTWSDLTAARLLHCLGILKECSYKDTILVLHDIGASPVC